MYLACLVTVASCARRLRRVNCTGLAGNILELPQKLIAKESSTSVHPEARRVPKRGLLLQRGGQP